MILAAMPSSVLKLVYICNELVYISANHVAMFMDIKYKG